MDNVDFSDTDSDMVDSVDAGDIDIQPELNASDTDEDEDGDESNLYESPPTPMESPSHPANLVATNMIPNKMVKIVALLLSVFGLPSGRVRCVELFAGCHSISNAFKAKGHGAVGLDMLTVSHMDDMNSSEGFLRGV
eukprot:10725612-Karenia_brevis.AAC.1